MLEPCVRYDKAVKEVKATVSDGLMRSPIIRRCSDAYTSNQCLSRGKDASILSRPTIMGHYKRLVAIFTA
eukprot:scaffold1447_cov105-Skeletonema_marinoi.AAC.2